MSTFAHILTFSTSGHIFYLIMHLVDYSMFIHECLFMFSFGCAVSFCVVVCNIFHQSSVDGLRLFPVLWY